ncbi:MAG: hypothetical protein WC760_04105 [Bacteroidia bacterium]|jgi:hypothetical protein
MKTDPENIPSELFDWIQTTPFRELDGNQQAIVSHHFTESTYTELHAVASAVHTQQVNAVRKRTMKNDLLREFDRIHPVAQSDMKRISGSLPFYRIAAALLLISCLGMLAWMRLGNKPAIPALALHDTIYITREIAAAPIREYDTVYLTIKGKPAKQNSSSEPTDLHPLPQSPASIDVVGMSDMEALHNRPKNNSMKDDTLLRSYSYVAL